MARDASLPLVVLTDLLVFGRSLLPDPSGPLRRRISEAQEVVLGPDQHTVTFEFAALHFARPEKNRYAYRLEGFDESWVGNRNLAVYTNLSPGKYLFRVKAANADGIWNDDGASIRLTILPPWWRTTWAYALYGMLLLAGLVTADRIQRRRVIREEREKARQRELSHVREIERMNERLRAQEAQLRDQNAVLEGQRDQLEKQKQRLVELDAQKSRFFANLSHEFRTPLTLLLGPLRDAMQGRIEPKRLAEQVPVMHRNAQRLLGLINQLLDFSKVEAGAMQLNARRMDLHPFLRDLVAAFSARAERDGIALSFSAESKTIPARFDPEKLEKAVANLISNAFKFTPSGGKIRVGVATERGFVAIAVKDTGQGIPKSELPRIFDRFYQVDGSATHEGTGIGLALARELVELHEGSITEESEVGFGSTFTIRLPANEELETSGGELDGGEDRSAEDVYERVRFEVEADSNGSGAAEDETVPAPPEAPTVLIVEDNPDVRSYLRSHLAGTYRVLEATDGQEGLAQVSRYRPDLVLADVMMPKMDGYSFCRELKSDPALEHIPVVLITAKADMESKLQGLETGADDYLVKPFAAEELLTRMENLIELRRRLRQRLGSEIRLGPSEITVSSEEAAFLEGIRDRIEARMGESSFGVDELAGEMRLSPRQLQRRLRAAAGLSPAAYIRMMRLERAAQLLEQDAGLVSDVAYRVGFKNANHFSDLFRQVFGVPPSEYPLRTANERVEPD